MAEILQPSDVPGLVLTKLDDGRVMDLPQDVAQQMVLESQGPVPNMPLPGPPPPPEAPPPFDPSIGSGPPDASFFEQPAQAAPQGPQLGPFGIPQQPAAPPPGVGQQPLQELQPEPPPPPQGDVQPANQPRSLQGTPGGLVENPVDARMAPFAQANNIQANAILQQAEAQTGIDSANARAEEVAAAVEAGIPVRGETPEEQARIDKALWERDQVKIALRAKEQGAKRGQQRVQEAIDAVPTADPKRAFKNLGTYGQAMAAFAGAMGGWLQLMHGGENGGLEAIKTLLAHDMETQQTDIATAREKVYRTENLTRTANETASEKLINTEKQWITGRTALIKAFQAEGNKYQSKFSRAKAQQLIGGLAAENAASADRIMQAETENELQRAQLAEEIRARKAATAQAAADRRAALAQSDAHHKDDMALKWAALGRNPDGTIDTSVKVSTKDALELEEKQIKLDALKRERYASNPKGGDVLRTDTGAPVVLQGTPEGNAKFNEEQGKRAKVIEMTMEFQQLQDEARHAITVAGRGSEKGREVEAKYQRMLSERIKQISGTAAADSEVGRLKAGVPLDNLLRQDTSKIIEGYLGELISEYGNQLHAHAPGQQVDFQTQVIEKLRPPPKAPEEDGSLKGRARAIEIAVRTKAPIGTTIKKVDGQLKAMLDTVVNHPNEMDSGSVNAALKAAEEAASGIEATDKSSALLIRERAMELLKATRKAGAQREAMSRAGIIE